MPRSCQLPIERNIEHDRVYIPEVRKRNNNNLPEAVIIIENRKYMQISDYYLNKVYQNLLLIPSQRIYLYTKTKVLARKPIKASEQLIK